MSELLGYMFQNEETGVMQFVDVWQRDNGFANNNPRLIECYPIYDNKALQEKYAAYEKHFDLACEVIDALCEHIDDEHTQKDYDAVVIFSNKIVNDALMELKEDE